MATMGIPYARFLGWNITGDIGDWTFWTKPSSGTTFYPKRSPEVPDSQLQDIFQERFVSVAQIWRSQSPARRQAWLDAANKLSLNITGYNLFTYYQLTNDAASIRTVERNSNETLI